jgi:hypothetical protein
MRILRLTWRRWKAAAYQIGHVQTMILLSIVYLIAVGPIAVIGRLSGNDFLGLRRSERSYWSSLPELTSSIERAEQPF